MIMFSVVLIASLALASGAAVEKRSIRTISKPNTLKNVSLTDPMTHLKHPMKYFVSRFEDVEKMVGTKAAYFITAMKFSADTWFIRMAGMAGFMATSMAIMGGMTSLMGQTMMGFLMCGPEIVNMNKTITEKVQKMEAVYDAALDKVHPIISKGEYETSWGFGQPTTVFVTARLNGQEARYQSSVPYNNSQRDQSAKQMAMENGNKFK